MSKKYRHRVDAELDYVPSLSLEDAAKEAAMMFPAPQGDARTAILIHRGWEFQGPNAYLSPYTGRLRPKESALMVERRRSTICLLQAVLPNYRTNRMPVLSEATRAKAVIGSARAVIEKKALALAKKYAATDSQAKSLLGSLKFLNEARGGKLPPPRRTASEAV